MFLHIGGRDPNLPESSPGARPKLFPCPARSFFDDLFAVAPELDLAPKMRRYKKRNKKQFAEFWGWLIIFASLAYRYMVSLAGGVSAISLCYDTRV